MYMYSTIPTAKQTFPCTDATCTCIDTKHCMYIVHVQCLCGGHVCVCVYHLVICGQDGTMTFYVSEQVAVRYMY